MAMTAQRVDGPAFGEVRVPREYVITQQGRDYVLAAGLIAGLHQLSAGHFDVETRIEQLPAADNGMLAVCSAKVSVFAPDDADRVLRSATGIGDASPQNVGRLIIPHLVRMAETRALSRALRTLLNVGAAALEELGPAEDDRPAPVPARPQAAQPEERIRVGERVFTRTQVWQKYTERRAQAREVGLALDVDETGKQSYDPLPVLVAATQSIRKKLDGTGSPG
jgi:hypothetical protein